MCVLVSISVFTFLTFSLFNKMRCNCFSRSSSPPASPKPSLSSSSSQHESQIEIECTLDRVPVCVRIDTIAQTISIEQIISTTITTILATKSSETKFETEAASPRLSGIKILDVQKVRIQTERDIRLTLGGGSHISLRLARAESMHIFEEILVFDRFFLQIKNGIYRPAWRHLIACFCCCCCGNQRYPRKYVCGHFRDTFCVQNIS